MDYIPPVMGAGAGLLDGLVRTKLFPGHKWASTIYRGLLVAGGAVGELTGKLNPDYSYSLMTSGFTLLGQQIGTGISGGSYTYLASPYRPFYAPDDINPGGYASELQAPTVAAAIGNQHLSGHSPHPSTQMSHGQMPTRAAYVAQVPGCSECGEQSGGVPLALPAGGPVRRLANLQASSRVA